MNSKLLVAGITALFSFSVIASNEQALTKEEINKKNKEILAKAGIEIPEYNEINIVTANKYINSMNIKDANDAHLAKKMREYLVMNDEQQKNGYVNDNEPRAKELLDLKNTAAYQKKKYNGVLSAESTHIRDSSTDLKLAYTFVGVPPEDMDISIGFAPYGAYKSVKNGDGGDGWDGAVQFFDKNGIGSCAFSEHNRKLSGLGVELIKELVSYDVQNRPTVILVKGTKESGYVYKIKWYDPTFSRELECANMEFSPQIKENVIALASRIESYQQP
ncbi:hypothetical protein Lgra_2582 [Legionella gratiana]|uniref:Uncharacterized protein n=1 Tax=Legionella gratiana TaxID=45066 RepID=A0A378J5C3_9GAMM|nr:hypothetical protein [Legionella gratiana]KTD05805.1 hypothetical protein Lgra_2582 [Legionella gratiana]STX42127.1 Uncharacterised protein [Legionella gratiana]